MLRSSIVVVLLACGLLLGGCSTFERDWRAAATPAAGLSEAGQEAVEGVAAEVAGVEGRWSGTWQSEVNGHSGGLRCIIAEDETTGGLRAFRYHATYGAIFTFEYAMPMAVERDGDAYAFSADADLGWLAGGRYHYEGRIAGDEFFATYECQRDRGTFTMTRVP